MSKKMLINASHPEENRVAIVVDGILSELDIEIAGQEQTKGNIYKAVVVRVESGLQAAFVDYGAEKMGFLQIGEIHPNIYPNKENPDSRYRPRINEILQRGQEILVQIVKEERGTKGAALTTFLSLPGRYMVLMPDSKTKGVSRKITDEAERKQLKRTMAELELPERMGYIVRTAGIGKEQEELKRDFDYLVNLYQGILNRKDQVKAPTQLYQESNLVIRSIRDYFSNEIDEVLIDDSKVYQEAKDFFSLVMPEQVGLVRQHRERRPIFSRYQIEEQIDGLARNQIPLPSGGSIVIDQTEALVAIDVNSGKMSSESGIEATAGKTNLEAAEEVGRQLRLRDLGGLIVIDFIDMRDRKKIREVEQTLRNSLRDDKAKVTVGRISQFGLLEMSRQRIKGALSVGAYLDCPHCQGKGRVKSIEAQAVALLRQTHAAASKGQIGKIEIRSPLDVATYLLNEKRSTLTVLEKQLNLNISIVGCPDFIPGQVELELLKREKQLEQTLNSVPITHANQIEEALAAANQEQPEAEEPVDAVEAVDSTAENTGESTGRKRRRRRRRRGGRKETDDQADTTTATTTVAADSEQPESVSEADQMATGKPESAPEVVDPAPSKPRSRRGARKPAVAKNQESATQSSSDKKSETENHQKEKPGTEQLASAKPDIQQPETVVPQEKEIEAKPKRRAPRKLATKNKPSENPADETKPEAAETVASDEEKAPASKPKRRAPRKPAAKKVASEQPPATATAAPETVTESAAKQSETQVANTVIAEEKPNRRAPRKTAAKKIAEADTKNAQEKTETASEKAENTAAEKPKRRTTARKPAKQKTADINEPQVQASEEKTSEAPKRRTRRKSPAKPDTPQAETAEKSPEEKPKRRTTRKTTAAKPQTKPESQESATQSTAKSETATTKAPPKRRAPRKASAKTTEVSAKAPTAEQSEAKPKRRTPRKSAPKKAEDSASTASEQSPRSGSTE